MTILIKILIASIIVFLFYKVYNYILTGNYKISNNTTTNCRQFRENINNRNKK